MFELGLCVFGCDEVGYLVMIVVIIVFELRVDVDFVDEYVDGGY